MVHILVPADRVVRWCENFDRGHEGARVSVAGAALRLDGGDGSTAVLRLPFAASYDGPADPASLAAAVTLPGRWGVLLVRKGGFAVARLERDALVAHKIGQRHVQGRTKAGGQSQQRFARRRDNQARAAYEAATDHAVRILHARLGALVTGGDRPAVAAVLEDPRLAGAAQVRCEPWLAVPDPRRAVLDAAVLDAACVAVEVHNTTG